MEAENPEGPGPQDEQEETPQEKGPKIPTQTDYLAGAMLANGIVWVWMQALSLFRGVTSQLPIRLLTDASFLVYVFAGYFSASQVGKRADTKHLNVGLRTAGYSWIGSLIIMFTMASEPTLSLAVTLLICFVAGSVVGGYMIIRRRLQKRRQTLEASS
ncbi:MAG: hypothetical protein NWE89_11060 [Candidatus Bathyarchaeota archaeon]|nr:hypothetical protein [Candidatus Bathyarchaeota archaeon]